MSRKRKDSNVVDLAAVRRKKKAAEVSNPIREALQSMPIDQRAECIVDIFRIIAAEFAAMILEHVEPLTPKPAPTRRKR